MKPTRAEELYFDPEPDLFMFTERELADRALALAAACCRRAQKSLDTFDGRAMATVFRSVHLALRPARRADTAEKHQQAIDQAEFCPCPRRIP